MKTDHKKKLLFRRENKRALHHWCNDPGSEFRYERNTKAMKNFEGTHKSIKSTKAGQDYTPLYKFLLSKLGQNWDKVYSEAVSRLDSQEPIFRMVDLEVDEKTYPFVRLGESSIYSKLTVRDGFLVKVDPEAQYTGRTCLCCTHTFNGKVVQKLSEPAKKDASTYKRIRAKMKDEEKIDHDKVYEARLKEGKKKEEKIGGGCRVRMKKEFVDNLLSNGSSEHAQEFGGCEGIVEGKIYPGTDIPEVNVRWEPSGLRYGYFPENLEIV